MLRKLRLEKMVYNAPEDEALGMLKFLHPSRRPVTKKEASWNWYTLNAIT